MPNWMNQFIYLILLKQVYPPKSFSFLPLFHDLAASNLTALLCLEGGSNFFISNKVSSRFWMSYKYSICTLTSFRLNTSRAKLLSLRSRKAKAPSLPVQWRQHQSWARFNSHFYSEHLHLRNTKIFHSLISWQGDLPTIVTGWET